MRAMQQENASGASDVGGLVGAGNGIANSYFDSDVSNRPNSDTGAYTTVLLQTPTSNTGIYEGWDVSIWDFGTSIEYPTLRDTGVSSVDLTEINPIHIGMKQVDFEKNYIFPYLIFTTKNTEAVVSISRFSITPINTSPGHTSIGLKNIIDLRGERPIGYTDDIENILKTRFIPYNSFLNTNFV